MLLYIVGEEDEGDPQSRWCEVRALRSPANMSVKTGVPKLAAVNMDSRLARASPLNIKISLKF